MLEVNSTKYLYRKLSIANKRLKEATNVDEKMALANYIGNLYDSIGKIAGVKINPNKKRVFGSVRNYQKFIKKYDIYEEQMLSHFISQKEFHGDYLSEVLSDVEKNIMELDVDEELSPITTLTEGEFIGIFSDFMSSLHLDGMFQKYREENRIYTTIRKETDSTLGFTLFNPLNGDTDIFVGDFLYDIHAMFTLAHEFGHAYDLQHFDENTQCYNRYFYQSFFGETISKVFERLFLSFMIENGVLLVESKDKLFESTIINHDYLLGSYLLTLLDDEYFRSSRYSSLSREALVDLVKEDFLEEEKIREYILNSTYFDVMEDFNYAYGDILSMFLKDSIDDGGLSNEMMESFFQIRSGMFQEEFLREWGMGPKNYADLHKKELQLLKK